MKYKDFYKHLLEHTLEVPIKPAKEPKTLSRVDRVQGGKGDSTAPADVDPRELSLGITVEMEHTSDPELAQEIALDHLTENPKYYTILKASGLADELDSINPGSDLGNKDNPINKPCRHGTDITPTPGNNIVGKIGGTPVMGEKDGESNIDKALKSKEKEDLKQKDKDPQLELKEIGKTKHFQKGDEVIGIMGVNGGYAGIVDSVGYEHGKMVVQYTDDNGQKRDTFAFNLSGLNTPEGQSALKLAGANKNPIRLKEDATIESEKKHVTTDSKEHEVAWDGTKKGLPPATPTMGVHGGGKIEGTKKFGDTENRLMKLAGMGGMVTSPCVLGIVSNKPEIEVAPEEDGKEEIEIDLDEKKKLSEKPATKIVGPGITSDMVSKKPGQEGKKLRWSIPFNK